MTKDGREIEVEVVEVENTVPIREREREPLTVEPVAAEAAAGEWREWRQWQGRVRRLDSRWWPLWVILGFIALVLLATVGVAIGLVAVIYVLCRNLVRALLR